MEVLNFLGGNAKIFEQSRSGTSLATFEKRAPGFRPRHINHITPLPHFHGHSRGYLFADFPPPGRDACSLGTITSNRNRTDSRLP